MANLSNVSEERKILREIQSTHADDSRGFDTMPIVKVVEDILRRANLSGNVNSNSEGTQDLAADVLATTFGAISAGPKGTMLEALAIDIQKICSHCSGGDMHASTIEVLGMLKKYSWDAKVVITLAAFAVSYRELWLVILLGFENHPLAKSIAVLKQTPELSEINGVLYPQLVLLNQLLMVVLDMAKSLIEFQTLPSKYITPEDAPLAASMNQIAIAAYWSVRSIVACGARITSNIGITSGLVTSATVAWDLSRLVHKGRSVHYELQLKLSACHEFIEIKKKEAYKNLEMLFETPQIQDNVKILESLIYPNKDGIAPLIKVGSKERAYFEVLKGKTVLLYISDLDINLDEVATLDRIYKESREHENALTYEIIWLPIVDKKIEWTEEHENKFKDLQLRMSWYTLYHPSLLDEVVIKFIKEKWGFAKKAIVMSLNQFGKVVSQNALHMMLIWGNSAYPFTTITEQEMWTNQNWSIDFLINAIHPQVHEWVTQKIDICIFGGEDLGWIRQFTTAMRAQATQRGSRMELLYVGKHNAKEAVKKIINVITKDNLCHTVVDVTQVWCFWTRLESMLYSKMLHGKSVENDTVVKEVMSVLSFDGGHQGWGCVGNAASSHIVKGYGRVILNSVSRYREWEDSSNAVGFLGTFMQIVGEKCKTDNHCNRVELPSIEGGAQRRSYAWVLGPMARARI